MLQKSPNLLKIEPFRHAFRAAKADSDSKGLVGFIYFINKKKKSPFNIYV